MTSTALDASAEQLEKHCEQCKDKRALYACPRCRFRTCSLHCCKTHKANTGCTGKRDRTSFRTLSRMDDSTVRSDYFFLEEVLDEMSRKKKGRLDDGGSNQNSTPKLRRVVQQAQKRGITVQILPTFMERHQANKSWYKAKTDTLTWTTEFVIVPANTRITTQVDENDSEIEHIARKLVVGSDESFPLDSIIHFYVQKIPCPSNKLEYEKLNGCLRDSLSGKTVIEFPTIYCVPDAHVDDFQTTTPATEETTKIECISSNDVNEPATTVTSTD